MRLDPFYAKAVRRRMRESKARLYHKKCHEDPSYRVKRNEYSRFYNKTEKRQAWLKKYRARNRELLRKSAERYRQKYKDRIMERYYRKKPAALIESTLRKVLKGEVPLSELDKQVDWAVSHSNELIKNKIGIF